LGTKRAEEYIREWNQKRMIRAIFGHIVGLGHAVEPGVIFVFNTSVLAILLNNASRSLVH